MRVSIRITWHVYLRSDCLVPLLSHAFYFLQLELVLLLPSNDNYFFVRFKSQQANSAKESMET